MLSRSVVNGAPDASETPVGLTGARSRTWVRRASRNAGDPERLELRVDDPADELGGRRRLEEELSVRHRHRPSLAFARAESLHLLRQRSIYQEGRMRRLLAGAGRARDPRRRGGAGAASAADDRIVDRDATRSAAPDELSRHRQRQAGARRARRRARRPPVRPALDRRRARAVPASRAARARRLRRRDRGGRLAGTVRRAVPRTFSARPGTAPGSRARPLSARAARSRPSSTTRTARPGWSTSNRPGARALSVRRAFAIGSGFATRSPAPERPRSASRRPGSTGNTAHAAAGAPARGALPQRHRHARRDAVRSPPGAGKHAAVAFVHGSGPT